MRPKQVLTTLFLAAATSASAPKESDFAELQKILPDKLVRLRPPAAVCYNSSYDATECAVVRANWTTSAWRSMQIGGMQATNFEQDDGRWCDIGDLNSTTPLNGTCPQGSIPLYGQAAAKKFHILY